MAVRLPLEAVVAARAAASKRAAQMGNAGMGVTQRRSGGHVRNKSVHGAAVPVLVLTAAMCAAQAFARVSLVRQRGQRVWRWGPQK